MIFNILSGYNKLDENYPKLASYQKWLHALDRWFITNQTTVTALAPAYCAVKQGITSDLAVARTNVIIGFFEIIFGIAFLFLVMNSLHIVGPTHPKPLIDALIWMEIGLAYILVLMWKAYTDKGKDAKRYNKLADTIAGFAQPLTATKVCVGCMEAGYGEGELFHALCATDDNSYNPSWRAAKTTTTTATGAAPTDSEVQQAVTQLNTLINKLTADSGEANIARRLCASALRRKAAEADLQSPLELLYFWLNFIAGYGYLLGILAYYVPEQANVWWCKALMFGMSHELADWWGNLAGDVAWTIEPFFLLINGWLVARWLSEKDRVEAKKK